MTTPRMVSPRRQVVLRRVRTETKSPSLAISYDAISSAQFSQPEMT